LRVAEEQRFAMFKKNAPRFEIYEA